MCGCDGCGATWALKYGDELCAGAASQRAPSAQTQTQTRERRANLAPAQPRPATFRAQASAAHCRQLLSPFAAGDFTLEQFLCTFASELHLSPTHQLSVSQKQWKAARKHKRRFGAAGAELERPRQRMRMKESRLQAALAFMSDPAQLQQLAFGDHKLKLEDGTEIVVGAALLKTCVAEMYRDYCASCKVHDEAPLDEKNFRDLSCAVANGKTTRLGALDPVACQTERNFKRCRSYCDEAAAVSAASGAGVANAPGGDTAEDPAVRAEPPPTRQTRAQRDYHDYDDDDDDEGSEIDDESEDRLLSMLYEYADDDDGEEEEEEEVDDDEEEGEVEGWD